MMCWANHIGEANAPVMETSMAIPKEENEQDCHLCVSDRCYSTPLTTEVMSIAQYRTITPPKSSHSLFLDSLGIVGYGIPMGKYSISHSD